MTFMWGLTGCLLRSERVESRFNCKLLCLSQVGGGTVVFMSSSVPGEVSSRHNWPPTWSNVCLFARLHSLNMSQDSLCIDTRSAALTKTSIISVRWIWARRECFCAGCRTCSVSLWIMHTISGFGFTSAKEGSRVFMIYSAWRFCCASEVLV